MAGWPTPWRSALAFTVGMLLADGANGLWIAGLLRRADHRARIASRVMGLMVAAISFGRRRLRPRALAAHRRFAVV
jgi:high-affinity nickel-transport protein